MDEIIIGLFRRVRRRLHVNRLLIRFPYYFYTVMALYLLLFTATRLLALIPLELSLISLLVPVLAAGALVLLFTRHPSHDAAARAIDQQADTKDLFLTNMDLRDDIAGFQAVVRSKALAQAQTLKAGPIVPLAWKRPLRGLLIVLMVIGLAIGLMPQLDPFGKTQEREDLREWEEQLAAARKATQLRLKRLRQGENRKPNTEPVTRTLAELKKDLKQVKRSNKVGNLKKLSQHQQQIAELWRDANARKLGSTAPHRTMRQKFGRLDAAKASEWKRDLQRGKTDSMQKSMEKLQRKLRRLSKSQDPAEREQLQREMQQSMKEMKDFFANNMQDPQVQEALKRALSQLDMSSLKGLDSEALKGLQDSLNLTQEEIERLAQNLRDLKKLEAGLTALQRAKHLNAKGQLDGQGGEGCETIEDYADLYSRLMGGDKPGQGPGPGMGGPGTGEGGQAPEDPDQTTDFTPEMSQSALQAGKILLKMDTRGLGEKGQVRGYRAAVEEVKQGVSEAILQEQVPPVYHDDIQKYFDTLEVEEEEITDE